MLHFIRDRAQGWIAWFIVGLISIPFALWGVNSYVSGPTDTIVAEVNGEEVTQTALLEAVQRYRDQMRQMMGEEFNPEMFDNAEIRYVVLDDLIDQQLIRSAADELGLRISDRQIAQFIQQTPAFQRDGTFDSEQYQMVLARAGFTPTSYEASLRDDLLGQQLIQSVEGSTLVSEVEVERLLKLENQQREIAFGVVKLEDFLDDTEVDEADVRGFFDANQSSFTSPEQISLDYLELSLDDISTQVEVSEEQLQQYYVDNKAQFVGPEQRRASHILIEDNEESEQILAEIQTKLEEGQTFEELAETYSVDVGSAASGGDLGAIQRDVMEPAFEEAVFALENVGDISEPVKTEFGYHIIQLTDIDQSSNVEFADVKEKVEQQYKRQQAERQFYDKAEELANLTYENPETLDIAAETLGLDIKTSGKFTRSGGSGIAENQEVVKAAFSDDVLNQELNSQVLELSDTRLVVVRKNSHVDATLLPFDSVAPAITEQLRYQRASDLAYIQGESRLQELKSGASATQVFPDTWQPATYYGRDSQDISAQILDQAFRLPNAESTQYAGFTADNGNYVVIAVSDVKQGSVEDVEPEMRDGLVSNLTRLNGRVEMAAFLNTLRSEADIEIYESRVTSSEEE
ncbi:MULTISPECIES: SurA N-terminal domain-containing protein [unclassified Methylophaga]|jgi:peptidyl-prolyl cis-trans isomerase D|uniref:Periplasmic chaperone PpiD n=1 Tax=Pseudidiomarina aestuarii TaxID=624146 RepID=A0A2T4CY49_9GAMM|nr:MULTISPECIES: SurA N-terminal domain-containing protein [unclassified Methylophaga]MAL49335.1 parvulin peptidyl-prolyl isomerase [Methylophaga sp.]MBP25246.1 parvulin peptidyl-prolyl isomerase [Methylophaga sp.]PTB86470.1 parvulin peptidyl-prolyl isomerase [Pseudidiomarina aestuarii]|tara:strand:+ start:6093 stop:7985 length:1893 start_codon:yes stop_codon:yes gene_type:complete